MNDLALFACDEDLGIAVLGWERRKEFARLAASQEGRGMPTIDALWGGRYVPAVKHFFDREYGLVDRPVLAPNGVEGNFHTSSRKRKLKPRTPPEPSNG